jgi:hypothetical protein
MAKSLTFLPAAWQAWCEETLAMKATDGRCMPRVSEVGAVAKVARDRIKALPEHAQVDVVSSWILAAAEKLLGKEDLPNPPQEELPTELALLLIAALVKRHRGKTTPEELQAMLGPLLDEALEAVHAVMEASPSPPRDHHERKNAGPRPVPDILPVPLGVYDVSDDELFSEDEPPAVPPPKVTRNEDKVKTLERENARLEHEKAKLEKRMTEKRLGVDTELSDDELTDAEDEQSCAKALKKRGKQAKGADEDVRFLYVAGVKDAKEFRASCNKLVDDARMDASGWGRRVSKRDNLESKLLRRVLFKVMDVINNETLTAVNRYKLVTAAQDMMEAVIGVAVRIRTGSIEATMTFETKLAEDRNKLLKRKIARLPYKDYLEIAAPVATAPFRSRGNHQATAPRGGFGQSSSRRNGFGQSNLQPQPQQPFQPSSQQAFQPNNGWGQQRW